MCFRHQVFSKAHFIYLRSIWLLSRFYTLTFHGKIICRHSQEIISLETLEAISLTGQLTIQTFWLVNWLVNRWSSQSCQFSTLDGICGLMFLGDQILMLLEYISVVYITLYNMLNGLILRSARGVTFSHLLNSCK